MTNTKPWYRTVKRWGQTNLTEDDPALCDLEFWKKQWKRTKVQGLIINGGGIVAYYPGKLPLQYRAETLNGADYFGMWNKAARDAGLAVVARMDINRATKEFFEAHPDWFCLNKDGAPISSQGRYFSCVNGGYYTDYIPEVLKEIIERYHPDGFSDNSWKGLDRNTICYCENCKAKFKKDKGLDLPEAVDWNDYIYREWIRWSYQNRTDNWDLFNKVTKEFGGENCLWLGMLNADPVNLCGGFGDLKVLCERSRIIFNDHQSRDMLSGFEQNSLNGGLLRLSANENAIAPESMANYVRGARTFRLSANPPQETRLWSIEGIAGGISPWYHHIGGSTNDRRQFETPVELFNWHSVNEDYLYNRESVANAAVVWSQQNADFYGRGDAKEKVAYPWIGICRALSKARILFLPINAADIGGYSHRIKTLILPDVAVLTAKQELDVINLVKNGGNLVLSGNSSAMDENGEKRSSPLWEMLGLRDLGARRGVFGVANENWEHFEAHSYLLLPKERHEILSPFADTDILPFGGGLTEVQSTGTLKNICGYVEAFPIFPPEFSWIRERKPEVGTVFAGRLPGGGRAVYLAADLDRCYGRSLLPDHGKLLEAVVRWAADDDFPFKAEGPGQLDCCAYKQGEKRVIHIVNISGSARNPGYCDEFFPVGPVTVSIKLDAPVSFARLTVALKDVPVKIKDGFAIFTVEKITDHEMAVV